MKQGLATAAWVLALGLAGCGETLPEAPAPQPAEYLDLVCSAFAAQSVQGLAATYGAENLRDEMLPGPEGQSDAATVLFPDDPIRRLEIVWRDADARTAPASVAARGEGWVGDNGLRVGDTLERVHALNGASFRLWGFGWDYGGWVSEWNGGSFAPDAGCVTRVRFAARANVEAAMGDREFSSDDAAMREAQPVVTEVGLSFATR